MPHQDALAAAAHLHVVLRRKTGRVTDTEWMAGNAEYAQAMVRFARERAQEDGHEDLLPLAARLESLVMPPPGTSVPPAPGPAMAPARVTDVSARYIGRLR